MSSFLVAVSAYAGDIGQVVNNLPLYQQHGEPVLVLSPKDKPIIQLPGSPQGVYYQQAGEAQWAGQKAIHRHAEFLKILLRAPYDRYLFHDADSVCLEAKLPEYPWTSGDVWWSNEVRDTNQGESLLPKIALQCPYAFTRRTLARIVAAIDHPAPSYVQATAEGAMPVPTDCPDHYALQLAHGAGVEHRSYPDGASWETESDVGLREMTRKVRDEGCIWIHSVKSVTSLWALRNARREFLLNHPT